MPIDERICDIISDWFEKEKGGSLKLPDGWFGRPMGNIHELTFIVKRPRKLIIELDEQVYLIFTELESVRIDGPKIIFSEFRQLVFDWQEYAHLTPHMSLYNSGEVQLVSLYGTVERNLAKRKDRNKPWLGDKIGTPDA
jgi:hypothetical protein